MLHKLPTLLFCLSPLICWAQEREAWTSSNLHGSPEPPLPYVAESIWPHITFSSGVDITLLESEDKFFVTERLGKIWMLPADLSSDPEKAELVIDMNLQVNDFLNSLGLAFHPNFEKNREIFIYYTINIPDDDRAIYLSRFRMDEAFHIIPGSEENLVHFFAWGHTGGEIQFGPDGMLYFSVGDTSPPSPPDIRNEGQNLGSLASTIARIDVDRKDPGLPYHIPKDNPFVGLEGARPEIWAYGFRNPWKFCFRPDTNEIWAGDVGWEMWEMVYRVEKGGNYGWSIMEGPVPTKPLQNPGPSPISPPTATYSHLKGASVTGGYFVGSSRLPEFQGAYIYGDYVTGKVWALNWDGTRVTHNREIADTRKQIVSFGQDPNGDLIFLDFRDNQPLYRLVPNTAKDQSSKFPERLSETGVFSNTKNQKAAAGVYSFSINTSTWQDGFDSQYWVAMPGTSGVKGLLEQRRNSPIISYDKPKDMVLAKTIHHDGLRVETQILHFDGYWKGYSYQWNKDQTDATLVDKEGLDATVSGKPYRFPSRDECIRCHGSNFNRPLAFFPGQLNRDGQLEKFNALGIIDHEFVKMADNQPLKNPSEEAVSLELRARSWLHANCSHCHRVSGGSGITSQMNSAVPTDRLELIQFPPFKGSFGLENASLIEPGNPYRSILYYRIATQGAGHMPMIGPKTIDKEGVRLIHDWIRSLNLNATVPEATIDPGNVEEALILYHKLQSGQLSEEEAEQAIANCLSSTDPFIINLFTGYSLN